MSSQFDTPCKHSRYVGQCDKCRRERGIRAARRWLDVSSGVEDEPSYRLTREEFAAAHGLSDNGLVYWLEKLG